MHQDETRLARLIEQADVPDSAVPGAPLDARKLLAEVAARKRQRIARRGLLVTTVVVLAVLGGQVGRWRSEPKADHRVDLASLAKGVEQLERQTAELRERVAARHHPTYDILTAMEDERAENGPSMSELRRELAMLESRVAASDDQLDWNIEWARSGALRLELARIEARIDPTGAQDEYRQIAVTYAGTRWGEEARLALAGAAHN